MIETIYPEHIQAQLDLLDEMIVKVYEDELPKENAITVMNITEIERKKKILYERTRPLLEEKVRLIQNSCPKYVIKNQWYER